MAQLVALQLGPAEPGQPTQTDMATPREGQAALHGNVEAPDPTAVGNWTEERMLELATSLPAMRTSRHQPRGLETKDVRKTQEATASHELSPPMGQEA